MATRHQVEESAELQCRSMGSNVEGRRGIRIEGAGPRPGGARLPKDSIVWSNRCLVHVSYLQPGKASSLFRPHSKHTMGPAG